MADRQASAGTTTETRTAHDSDHDDQVQSVWVPVAALSAVPTARYPADRDPLRVNLRRLGARLRGVMGMALERQARLLTFGAS